MFIETYYCDRAKHLKKWSDWCPDYDFKGWGITAVVDSCATCSFGNERPSTPTPAPDTPSSSPPSQTTDDRRRSDGGDLRGRGVE